MQNYENPLAHFWIFCLFWVPFTIGKLLGKVSWSQNSNSYKFAIEQCALHIWSTKGKGMGGLIIWTMPFCSITFCVKKPKCPRTFVSNCRPFLLTLFKKKRIHISFTICFGN